MTARHRSLLLSAAIVWTGQAAFSLTGWAGSQGTPQPTVESRAGDGCKLDLSNPGKMSDIISNALNRGLDRDSKQVRDFLNDARGDHSDGQSLLAAAAEHFELELSALAAEVERYRHCNCTHPGGERSHLGPDGKELPVTKFAGDVTLHVVLHEIGHALVREFDLPILGNEETLADAFATHYLTTYLPERAFDVLSARTRSLMIEASEVSRDEWSVSGEHNSDARRALQIAALAIAADRDKYRPIATAVGMSDKEIGSAADYGTEIHRSWRRILKPLWMPTGQSSSETKISFEGDSVVVHDIRSSELKQTVLHALRSFDWHSQVKILFKKGEGTAGWNRSKRTVTVYSQYVQRFIRQGRLYDAQNGG